MTIKERIAKLEEFKERSLIWEQSTNSAERQANRTYLNKNRRSVRREVIEAGCHKTLTISPPSVVGGLLMKNVDPFHKCLIPRTLGVWFHLWST